MYFDFSKKKDEIVTKIRISKPDCGDGVSFLLYPQCSDTPVLSYKADELSQKIRNYNSGMFGNERHDFDDLFPESYRELAKVIGITNSLGHFFSHYDTATASFEAFTCYINQMKGFVFVDWEAVSTNNDDPQLLYLTNDEETEQGKDLLNKYYEAGHIFRIDYQVGNENGIIYCLDSIILNKGRNAFVNSLRSKINEILTKRFPR